MFNDSTLWIDELRIFLGISTQCFVCGSGDFFEFANMNVDECSKIIGMKHLRQLFKIMETPNISTKKLNIEFLGPTRDRQTERFGSTGDVHRFLRWTTVGIDALEYSDRVDGIIWFWTNWKGLSRCWRCLQDYCDSWNLFFRGFLWQYS